jgi:hypothetical protein
MTMKERYYRHVNAELDVEFALFAVEHPDWLTRHVPEGAIVVFQTQDPDFNTWARKVAERNRRFNKPRPPVVLVHIRKLRQRKSRILRVEAELVTPRKVS